MAERRYQEVQSRSQVMLLPACLDDYVSEHNAVRAIDAFVGTLDLQALGFEHAEANCGVGQPAFDPALLLKLYLYGYQHRVRSSRRLEAETRRNLEVIWLCQSASPSYKTIADFRKSNAAALQAANREFVLLCRELSLLGGSRVAVDGTFLKADANPDSIHTKRSLERDLKPGESLLRIRDDVLALSIHTADSGSGFGSARWGSFRRYSKGLAIRGAAMRHGIHCMRC